MQSDDDDDPPQMPFYLPAYLWDNLNDAVTKVAPLIDTGDPIYLQMATGMGKTVFLTRMLSERIGRKVILIISDDNIVKQTLNAIEAAMDYDIGLIDTVDNVSSLPTVQRDVTLASANQMLNILSDQGRRATLKEYVAIVDDVHIAVQEGKHKLDLLICLLLSAGSSGSPIPERAVHNTLLSSASPIPPFALSGLNFSTPHVLHSVAIGSDRDQGHGNIKDQSFSATTILAHVKKHSSIWSRLAEMDSAAFTTLLQPVVGHVTSHNYEKEFDAIRVCLHRLPANRDWSAAVGAVESALKEIPACEVSSFSKWLNMSRMDICQVMLHHIVTNPGQAYGSILVFLNDIDECMDIYRSLAAIEGAIDEGSVLNINNNSFRAVVFDSTSGLEIAFSSAFANSNGRYVILSTGTMENSVTVENLTHVVNNGQCEQMTLDAMGVSGRVICTLPPHRNMQRRGRLGRMQPFGCYTPLFVEGDGDPPFELDVLSAAENILICTFTCGAVTNSASTFPYTTLRYLLSYALMVRPSESTFNAAMEFLIENRLLVSNSNQGTGLHDGAILSTTAEGEVVFNFLTCLRINEAIGFCCATLCGVPRTYLAMTAAINARGIFKRADVTDPNFTDRDHSYLLACGRLLRHNAILTVPRTVDSNRNFEISSGDGDDEALSQHVVLQALMKRVVQLSPETSHDDLCKLFGLIKMGIQRTCDNIWKYTNVRNLNKRAVFQGAFGFECNTSMLHSVLALSAHIGRVEKVIERGRYAVKFVSSHPQHGDQTATCISTPLCDVEPMLFEGDWVLLNWIKKTDSVYTAGLVSKLDPRGLVLVAQLSPHMTRMMLHLENEHRLHQYEEEISMIVPHLLTKLQQMRFDKSRSGYDRRHTWYLGYRLMAEADLHPLLFKALHLENADYNMMEFSDICKLRYWPFTCIFLCHGCCSRCYTHGHKAPMCNEMGNNARTARVAIAVNKFFSSLGDDDNPFNTNPHKLSTTRSGLADAIYRDKTLFHEMKKPFNDGTKDELLPALYINCCCCGEFFFGQDSPNHKFPFSWSLCDHVTRQLFERLCDVYTITAEEGQCALVFDRTPCPECHDVRCSFRNKDDHMMCTMTDEHCFYLGMNLLRIHYDMRCVICNLFTHVSRFHSLVVSHCKRLNISLLEHEQIMEERVRLMWATAKLNKWKLFKNTPDVFKPLTVFEKCNHEKYPIGELAFERPPSYVTFSVVERCFRVRD